MPGDQIQQEVSAPDAGTAEQSEHRLTLLEPTTVSEYGGLQARRAVSLSAVPLDVLVDAGRRMAGAEVGAVTAEDLDPLLPCEINRLGDQVRHVAVPSACHADVCGSSARALTDREMCGVDGLSLGAVNGRGEGKLDIVADVFGGQYTLAGAADEDQAAVVPDAGDGPDVAVRDPEVAVIAAGGDTVTEPHALTTTSNQLTTALASGQRAIADGGVDGRDLLPGVSDDQLVASGTDIGKYGGALDLGGYGRRSGRARAARRRPRRAARPSASAG